MNACRPPSKILRVITTAGLLAAASCNDRTAGPTDTSPVTVTAHTADQRGLGGITVRVSGAAAVEQVGGGRLFTREAGDHTWIVLIGDGQEPLRFRYQLSTPTDSAQLRLVAAVDAMNRNIALDAGTVRLEVTR